MRWFGVFGILDCAYVYVYIHAISTLYSGGEMPVGRFF